MAGIGFELKKIADKKNYFAGIRAYAMSAIITVGPMIISILLFLIMQWLLKGRGETYKNIQIFNAVIVYSFLISYVCTNGINMLVSRFVSDCIYLRTINYIFESLLGSAIISSGLSFILINIVLYKSPLSIYIKLSSVLITVLLSVVWLQVTYISAIKDYLKVSLTFVVGFLIIIGGSILGIDLINIKPLVSGLLFTTLGYLFICVAFFIILYKDFGISDLKLRNCLYFIKSIDKYYELIFIGLFLALGAYGHNIFVWLSKDGTLIGDTFKMAAFYDVPSFYAFLSIIPTVVIFTLRVETKIYPKYKEFYSFVKDSGSINEIRKSKKKLIDSIILYITNMIEIQFIWSFAFIVLGFKFLPLMGFANESIEIFGVITMGALSYITMSFLVIILLYFDRRKESLKVSFIFFLGTTLFSIISVLLGREFYGFGFFVGCVLSVIIAFREVNVFFKNIEYRTFSAQPMFNIVTEKICTKIYNFIFRIKNDRA